MCRKLSEDFRVSKSARTIIWTLTLSYPIPFLIPFLSLGFLKMHFWSDFHHSKHTMLTNLQILSYLPIFRFEFLHLHHIYQHLKSYAYFILIELVRFLCAFQRKKLGCFVTSIMDQYEIWHKPSSVKCIY